MSLLEKLGGRIRAQREKRGLKQQDLASALGISPQAVSKWERGENAPDIALLAPLGRLLGVSTDWLLAAHAQNRDVFEATVLTTSVAGAHQKSVGMEPRDFATWANALFSQLTELTLRHDGIPVKYVGDGYLCFFSGVDHGKRAVDTAIRAKVMIAEDLKVGLAMGDIYLGSVGHPDYARPDIMGEVVNIAFLTMQWAEANTKSGIAVTKEVLDALSSPPVVGQCTMVDFKDVAHTAEVCELIVYEKTE